CLGVQARDAQTKQKFEVRDTRTGALRWSFPLDHHDAWDWQISPDSRRVYVQQDRRLVFLDLTTGRPDGAPLELDSTVSFAVSPDGRRFATGTTAGLQVWDAATRKSLGRVVPPDGGASNFFFSPDG